MTYTIIIHDCVSLFLGVTLVYYVHLSTDIEGHICIGVGDRIVVVILVIESVVPIPSLVYPFETGGASVSKQILFSTIHKLSRNTCECESTEYSKYELCFIHLIFYFL